MPKIDLNEADLKQLFDAINNSAEPPQELIPKLFPSFAEKLRQDGKFDFEGLTKFKIPTIEYAGKRPEGVILASASILGQAAPLQVIRKFGEPNEDGWQNMIVQGDNLQFLKTCYLNQDPLIKDKVKGKVKLIYIDPPFGTGDEYEGNDGEMSYSAKIAGSEYIESLREGFIFLKELLSHDGSIYIRSDYHFSHYIKVVLDDVYGKNNFKNEIIVNRTKRILRGLTRLNAATDTVFFYTKSQNYHFKDVERNRICTLCGKIRDPEWIVMRTSGLRNPPERVILGRKLLPPKGMHWMYTQDKIDQMTVEGRIRINESNSYIDLEGARILGMPEYLQTDNTPVDTNWTDIPGYSQGWDYPTENSENVLERIISLSSKEGDLVMDVFAGSGTTAAVAEKLGRRWIMCDFGKHAIYTMQKRLLNIANSKALDSSKKNEKYGKPPKPFSIVSVGAYDFTRVMDLRKNKDAYISFVLALFGIPKEEKDFASKYRLDSIYAEKDGDPVEIFPVWDDEYLYNVRIDEDYLKEIVVQSRGRLKGNFYIIVPENCTVVSDITLPNSAGDQVNFRLLKFPYKILEEISRNFAIEEQPDSASNINNLVSSVGFYFNNEVSVTAKRTSKGITIDSFKTLILNKEGKVFEGLDGLSLVLIDFNYDGKVFNLGKAVYVKEISDNGEIQTEGVTDKTAIIAIDKHGNESKPIYVNG